MISLLDKDNKLNQDSSSLNISYKRNVNIIFGSYPYPDIIHNFIMSIRSNLKDELESYTNVQGGRTDWKYFLDKPDFINFISFLINKHQASHPGLFKYFFEKRTIQDAWGNEIKKGDSVNYHTHSLFHGILYLTKGCDLILPELNLKITPEPGDYYIFPPEILHGFDPSKEDNNRYSLVFNIAHITFDYGNKLKKKGQIWET